MKTRLDIVLSGKTTVGNVTDTLEDAPVAAPVVDTKEVSAPIVETQVEESDDSMDYFNKLANA